MPRFSFRRGEEHGQCSLSEREEGTAGRHDELTHAECTVKLLLGDIRPAHREISRCHGRKQKGQDMDRSMRGM